VRRLRDRFDVIYLDPPYDSDVYDEVLPLLGRVLAPGGEVFVEHDRRRQLPDAVDGLRLIDRRTYGDTTLSVYAAAPAQS
jgi:16S rRNA (guanine966-N2)-methyltransferase